MMSKSIEQINDLNYFVTEINVLNCKSDNRTYHEFEKAFDFPNSPNHGSIDVLIDYIQDLGWQKEKNFKVILKNYDKSPPRNRTEIDRFMTIAKEYWNLKKVREKNQFENNFIVTRL